ncbi:hypothetical protein FPCIR_11541 [Fusarium pseudocircinatum]|uniref:Uncharacterized protein n=1 Tax=Fusarium pseudocircinatum TaxID=56676 RepID=A0A8H5NWQ3_9HYPO|nr:hypothetical protein FPCIR_11541 [Fusarium pseudocircinatum]
MGSEEEPLRKRKNDEAHTSRTPIGDLRSRTRARRDYRRRCLALSSYCSQSDDTDEDDDENAEGEAIRPREANAPAPSPKERQLNRPIASTTDATLPSSQNTSPTVRSQRVILTWSFEMIQMRANMPSFLPTQKWIDVVRAAVDKGHKPPKAFPWTVGFAKKLHKATFPFQQELDLVGVNSRVGLPIDPDTKDWETVQRNLPEAA